MHWQPASDRVTDAGCIQKVVMLSAGVLSGRINSSGRCPKNGRRFFNLGHLTINGSVVGQFGNTENKKVVAY